MVIVVERCNKAKVRMGKQSQHTLKILDCSGVIVTNHYFFLIILFLLSLPISFASQWEKMVIRQPLNTKSVP